MLPLGGPKGSGLSLLFEMICSLGTGVPVLQNALRHKAPHIQNAALCALDIGRLQAIDDYKTSVDDLIALIKAQPKAQGVDEILMPGERAQRSYKTRAHSAIPVSEKIVSQLTHIATGQGSHQ
jgi:ureidoglycolate dehydrogenase (NAD+)